MRKPIHAGLASAASGFTVHLFATLLLGAHVFIGMPESARAEALIGPERNETRSYNRTNRTSNRRRGRQCGYVGAVARAAGVSSSVAARWIAAESGCNPRRRGQAGEYGLLQIKCATARSVGFRGNCGQLLTASVNIRWAARYYRAAQARGGRSCRSAMARYNQGIHSSGNHPNARRYARKVCG